MNYSGPVRITLDGVLLTVGTVAVADDEEAGTWTGTLTVLDDTGVAGKALVVELVMGDQIGRAQLIPERVEGEFAISRVVGLAPEPS
ncbi:MAG TPA: hypothetical protein VHL55_02625 [Acidimicrobiia bacterium]|jgi:hypothetical protein|nr:hypothetical protein [Acidimicrobiia bacterium]